jgi:hypothetical protein
VGFCVLAPVPFLGLLRNFMRGFPVIDQPVEKVAAGPIGGLKLDSKRPKTGLLTPEQTPGRAQKEFFNRLTTSRQLGE